MGTEVIVALMSGQLILVVWQIIKEVKEHKERKEKENSQERQEFEELKKMVFKLYRDNLERKIIQTYDSIDNQDPSLREYLQAIQDDMEVYLHAGGNSTVKDLYIRLAKHVREKLGESYYVLLVIDGLEIK